MEIATWSSPGTPKTQRTPPSPAFCPSYIGLVDGFRTDSRLCSTRDKARASCIRWSGIQQNLENTCSDTLILMDAAYYPSAKMVSEQGVLELVAASASEEHANALNRCAFTKALAELLRTRACQRFKSPFTAA